MIYCKHLLGGLAALTIVTHVMATEQPGLRHDHPMHQAWDEAISKYQQAVLTCIEEAPIRVAPTGVVTAVKKVTAIIDQLRSRTMDRLEATREVFITLDPVAKGIAGSRSACLPMADDILFRADNAFYHAARAR